jgi:putative tryptophan/tyrosine transport system substrate-binding protein
MRRRDFITVIAGSAAAWPVATRAQQSATPVIGLVSWRSANDSGWVAAAFHRGLSQFRFIEWQTVAIEYRWADYRWERLDALVADLVQRQVTVIAALGGSPTALAAKAATQTIPMSLRSAAILSFLGWSPT